MSVYEISEAKYFAKSDDPKNENTLNPNLKSDYAAKYARRSFI